MTNKQKAILYTIFLCLAFAAVITALVIFPVLLETVPYVIIVIIATLVVFNTVILPIYEIIKDYLDQKTKEENYQRNLRIEMEAAQAEAAQAKAEQLIRDNSPYPLDDVKATVQKVELDDIKQAFR